MPRKTMTEIFIGALAIISIILVAVEALSNVSGNLLIGIYIADLIICIIFALDFIQRIRASENKSRFIKTNGYEILALIPALAFYGLETLPALAIVLRSLRFIRVIRVILLLSRMRRMMSKTGRFVKKSNLIALAGITLSIILISAVAVLILDSGTEGSQISNFSDAIWWSITTVTTVGYGDIVPKSVAGRILGMFLMVIGIGVMAAFISKVSATLVESKIQQNRRKDQLYNTLITEIKSSIDRIHELEDQEVDLLVIMIRALRNKEESVDSILNLAR